ncbi:hypothetical protein GCM10010307_22280 [Streptomyces vastus]|uniref:Uncharacterized protein n=1 Tax=Streptomyces vastus TaxID=285451 RepID=A0ABN3QMT1_9ACTN
MAAQNAAQAWMRLPLHEAGPLASDLVNMLLKVAAPERTATMRAQIAERLGQLNKQGKVKAGRALTTLQHHQTQAVPSSGPGMAEYVLTSRPGRPAHARAPTPEGPPPRRRVPARPAW